MIKIVFYEEKMNCQELESEMSHIYQDYEIDYAYAFFNGMIYACRMRGDIDEDEGYILNKLNLKKFAVYKK